MSSTILVVGDVNGQLSAFFSKIKALHVKNSFAFLIVAGNLFADETTISDSEKQEQLDLINGKIEVPVTTYFALGSRALPASVVETLSSGQVELCANLSFLGRKVSVKTTEGFRIVAIGGSHTSTDDTDMDDYTPTYSYKDTLSAQTYKDTDLLVTSDWPAEIRDGSTKSYPGDSAVGVSSISELCSALKPRFHFSTSSAFYARERFFHPGPRPQPVTRFISLAPFQNAENYKWHYAVSTDPAKPPPETLPSECTTSPFIRLVSRKRKATEGQDGDESQNEFRFARSNDNGYHGGGRGKRRRNRPPPTQEDCFFCVGNENADNDLVVSLSNHALVTVAKGPLTTRSTFPALGHPLHMLIMPLDHKATTASMSEEDRQSILAEMQRYREAIHSMIASKSTNGADGEAQLGAVTWEISRAGALHLHWQIMPVPIDMVKKRVVEAAFIAEAENSRYPEFVSKASQIADVENGDYLKVSIWSESTQKEIFLPLDDSFRFDFQFPRRVMAKLLNLQSRTQWRDVVQTKPEEAEDVELFREMFKTYDFALLEAELEDT